MPTTTLWNLRQEMEILASPSPTVWGLLKVFVTYSEYPNEAFTWRMIGKELSYIKAWSIVGTQMILPLFYTSMKLKSIKHISVREDEEDLCETVPWKRQIWFILYLRCSISFWSISSSYFHRLMLVEEAGYWQASGSAQSQK